MMSEKEVNKQVVLQMKAWQHGGCSPLMEIATFSQENMLQVAKKVKKTAERIEQAPGRKFARLDNDNDNLNDSKFREEYNNTKESAEMFTNAWVKANEEDNEAPSSAIAPTTHTQWKCFETGFIFASPGALASAWHLESWEQYAMVYTLLSSPQNTGSVETFQQLYENVARLPWEPPAEVGKAMRRLKTPPIWPAKMERSRNGLPSAKSSSIGRSRLVFSNAIHRFPVVPFGEASPYNEKTSANPDWVVMYHVIGKEDYDTNNSVFQEQWANEYNMQTLPEDAAEIGDAEDRSGSGSTSDINIMN
jgi:hypothetical protein